MPKITLKKIIKAFLPYGIIWLYHNIVPLQRLHWKKNFEKNTFLYKNDPQVFTAIYTSGMWGSSESRSGGGSHIHTTETIRKMLPLLWKQYNVKTFLDVPCGDYNWMKEVNKDTLIYTGGDIVPELIARNNQKYKTEKVSFKVIDITQDVLPTVDMLFCKDCLQHLSYEKVFKALKNFKASKSKYLLTTSYPLTLRNWDIFDGDYRPLNLRIKPFNLPSPIVKIHEKSKGKGMEKDKYMYLYRLDEITI